MVEKQTPFISIIIPCYNEQKNLEHGALNEVLEYVRVQSFAWEVRIVNDESTDKSRDLIAAFVADKENFYLHDIPHGGKPAAVWEGVQQAQGDIILFTDMDQSTPIDQLEKLIPYSKKGYEVVIGSRGVQRKNFPIYRRLGAVVFMGVRKAMILPKINDTQCGFKLFESNRLEKAFPKMEFFKKIQKVKGWKVTSYDVELLHLLEKNGCKIKEVKVKWNDQDKSGSKGGVLSRYFKESKEMLMQIIRVKLNDIKGSYD